MNVATFECLFLLKIMVRIFGFMAYILCNNKGVLARQRWREGTQHSQTAKCQVLLNIDSRIKHVIHRQVCTCSHLQPCYGLHPVCSACLLATCTELEVKGFSETEDNSCIKVAESSERFRRIWQYISLDLAHGRGNHQICGSTWAR